MKNPPAATYRTDWHWGTLSFDGLFGLHGTYLCFHRHPAEDDPVAEVDPAKPVLPITDPLPETFPGQAV